MTARLPVPGGDAGSAPNDWGSILNDYLQQSLAANGTLVTGSTNSYTGSANTNLASTSQAGLVKLATDLGGTALLPNVIGLQGRAVDSAAPSDGNVLTWSASGSKWSPVAPTAYTAAGGGGLTLSSNAFSITAPVSIANGGTGNTSSLSGIILGNGTSAFTALTTPSGISSGTSTVVGTGDAQTLTNKRITSRVGSTASSATPAIDISAYDIFNITALATNITSMTSGLSGGTPTDGQKLIIRIKDNGTSRTITWGASFASSGVATLLAATVINKQHTVGLIYSSSTSTWVCLAVDATGY